MQLRAETEDDINHIRKSCTGSRIYARTTECSRDEWCCKTKQSTPSVDYFLLGSQTFESAHSESSHDDASSPTTNARVLNTTLSYMMAPAARAFLCHGPVPPALASSLFRQIPKWTVSVARRRRMLCQQLLLTCCQILMLPIFSTEPILQQTTTGRSFLV